jgi:uncharacterized protein YggL (DUF469 family)
MHAYTAINHIPKLTVIAAMVKKTTCRSKKMLHVEWTFKTFIFEVQSTNKTTINMNKVFSSSLL